MGWPTADPDHVFVFEGSAIRLWIADDGGLTIKCLDPSGGPVEITKRTARRIAVALLDLADRYETEL